MNDQPYMPDPAGDKRLLANLRCSRLEMAELGLQLEEVIAKLEHYNRQRRLQRLQLSRKPCEAEGVNGF